MRSYKRYIMAILAMILITVIIYTWISKMKLELGPIHEPLAIKTTTKEPHHSYGSRLSLSRSSDIDSKSKILKTKSLHPDRVSTDPDERPSLLQHINSPTKISPFNFTECRMSNCFDFTRCSIDGPLKVHIVPSSRKTQETFIATAGESNMIHQKILKIIRESKHFEPDARKACIFVPEDDTLDRDPLSQSFQTDLVGIFGPKQMYGMNHLVFNLYSGTWPDYRENDFAGLQFGASIVAKASNSITFHRSKFDISLPLFSYQHPTKDSELNREETALLENRTYFLTFKGKRYVIGKGSETRNNLYHIDNQRDVLMLTTCRHGKKWKDASDSRCSVDEANYDKHDFVDLMKKSRFCLTPRGRRLGSFRFLEALGYGCIPVILSDGMVAAFDEIIDWSNATVQFPENMLLLVPDMLRDIDDSMASKMRENCLKLYDKYFATVEKIILTTLKIIEKRVKDIVTEMKIKINS